MMPVTVEQAAQAVIDSWDSNTLDREKFCEGEYGSYWSPYLAVALILVLLVGGISIWPSVTVVFGGSQ